MKVKIVLALMYSLFVTAAVAQDAVGFLKKADEVAHNPKNSGMQDLVVDIVSPQLSKQLNDQMIFGRISEVTFRVYWTAKPERVAVEILGMPEGFREIKEELKSLMGSKLENVIPIPIEKKFTGYKFRIDSKQPRTVVAEDSTQLQAVLQYELTFDVDGKLATVVGKKPIGLITTQYTWEKAPWSEPRFYASKTVVRAEEGPQTAVIQSIVAWQTVNGIGFPSSVKTKTTQTLLQPGGGKPIERTVDEEVNFKNYKVNAGEAMKWFLGHSTATP